MTPTDRADAIRARLSVLEPGAMGVQSLNTGAPCYWVTRTSDDEYFVAEVPEKADAELLANAAADLAFLLSELDRLTTQGAELEADKTDLRACAEDLAAAQADRDLVLDERDRFLTRHIIGSEGSK